LFVREIDRLDVRALPGTEGAVNPCISPDGRWVGFVQNGKLRKIAIDGAAPTTITEVPGAVRGISWGVNDVIVFASTSTAGLFRVSAAGGTPEPLTSPDTASGETSHRWPEVLPNGQAVVFTSVARKPDDSRIEVVSLTNRNIIRLIPGASARFVR